VRKKGGMDTWTETARIRALITPTGVRKVKKKTVAIESFMQEHRNERNNG
jgi:hypothetical protein